MLTTGLQFAIGWWYSRSAVFYLPVAWLGPFTWWLSLPFAPAGESSHNDVMAPSNSRRVRFRKLRCLADSLSTCHQSGRTRGERIHKSASLLSVVLSLNISVSQIPIQNKVQRIKAEKMTTQIRPRANQHRKSHSEVQTTVSAPLCIAVCKNRRRRNAVIS
jgi:hypothetical protein